MGVVLTPELRQEYQRLFDDCNIRPERVDEATSLADRVAANRGRYETAGTPLGVPWFVVGMIHAMEGGLNFNTHLHNGDPLSARTVHVPKGRPAAGSPPFTWEASAADALTFDHLSSVDDWALAGVLYQLEKFNGFGYRTQHPDVLSPYLWSYSDLYSKGKYIADNVFDPDKVSKQCGAAVILRRMAERGVLEFDAAGNLISGVGTPPASAIDVRAALVQYSDSAVSEAAKGLQRALNTIPGIFLLVDGIPGRRTSDAFRRVTGQFLPGDPRSQSSAAVA